MSTTIGIIEESVWQQIRDGIYHAGGKDEEALVEKVASAWPASADRLLKEFHENRNQYCGAVDIITSKVLETCDRMGKLSDDEARRFALCCFDINPKEYRTHSVSSTLYSLRGRVSGVLAQMAGLADKVDDDLVKLQKRVFAEAECSDFYGPPYDLLDDLVRSKIRMIEHKEKKLWKFECWWKVAPWAYWFVATCLERTVIASTSSSEERGQSLVTAVGEILECATASVSDWPPKQMKDVLTCANNLVIAATNQEGWLKN